MSGPVFTAYGFTQPLIDVPQPIVAQRDPTPNDRSFIGNLWINKDTNSVFILTSILGPVFTWIGVSSGTGDVASFVTDAGNVFPNAGIVDVFGGLNINTSGATNVLTINLDNTVSITGSFTAGTTAGDITVDNGNINLPNTISAGSEGIIEFGGNRFINNIGSANTYVGSGAGNLAETGIGGNVGIGGLALSAQTTGSRNTVVGFNALSSALTSNANVVIGNSAAGLMTSGSGNVIIGFSAAPDAESTNSVIIGRVSMANYGGTGSNTAIGDGVLFNLLTGADNLVIGSGAGDSYDAAQSSNILLQNVGDVGDDHVIRIGTQGSSAGQQNTCFVAGIIGNTVGNVEFVTIDTITGQLGTSPTPGGGFTWQVVTGATPLVPNNGYIVNGSSAVQFTLPVTAAVGDEFEITVLGPSTATGWQINQNAGQNIVIGNTLSPARLSTTVGVTGNVSTQAGTPFTSAFVVCAVANTTFILDTPVISNIAIA